MTLRVATDISILGRHFGNSTPRTGTYTAVEQILTECRRRPDVATTAVSLCGTYPVIDSLNAQLYLESRRQELPIAFHWTVRGLPGLAGLNTRIFRALHSGTRNRRPAQPLHGLLVRSADSFLSRLSTVWPRRRVLDAGRFDVFHCPHQDVPPRDATGEVPRVLTVYDLIPVMRPDFVPRGSSEHFTRSLARIDVNRDRVICISEFTKQEFCEYTGMSAARVVVVPLAAVESCRPVTDPEAIAATRASLGIPSGRYFLSLAAPQPRKNLTHLIRSFFRLLAEKRLADTYLVIAGAMELGWMYRDVLAAAQSAPAYRSRLIFTGYVPEEALPALYSGAVAFVFPSLYEGFGLPALEAMACGTPVIASNTSSLPEVVGDAGLLIDPRDQDGLCHAMLNVLNDAALRRSLHGKGRERALAFSWKKCAAETVAALRSAADDRGVD